MNVQVENQEKNTAKITIEIPAEDFTKAMKAVYLRNRNKYNIPGFRKGKAPYDMVKKIYGAGIFFEDAANELIDSTYWDAQNETGLEVVSRPVVDIEQIADGEPFIYSAIVAVRPEVTLGEYKGVTVERAKDDVSEEDVDAKINEELEKNSRLVTIDDRPAKDGDRVTIDFDGYMDGEPFEGGKADNYQLVLGSHTFIDNFEDQIIGHSLGDEFDVNVTFPENYQAEDLAGKPAVFKVKINDIQEKQLPELDDEFAEEVSEFDTLEEYREDVRRQLKEEREKAATTENENRVIDKVVENASMEIPDAMIEDEADNLVNDYANRLENSGLTLEQYMQFTGYTMDTLREQFMPQAEKRIAMRLTLEAIAAAENIEISDERVDEEIEKMAESYGMEKEQVREYLGSQVEDLREDLAVQEAIDLIVAEAVLVDELPEEDSPKDDESAEEEESSEDGENEEDNQE